MLAHPVAAQFRSRPASRRLRRAGGRRYVHSPRGLRHFAASSPPPPLSAPARSMCHRHPRHSPSHLSYTQSIRPDDTPRPGGIMLITSAANVAEQPRDHLRHGLLQQQPAERHEPTSQTRHCHPWHACPHTQSSRPDDTPRPGGRHANLSRGLRHFAASCPHPPQSAPASQTRHRHPGAHFALIPAHKAPARTTPLVRAAIMLITRASRVTPQPHSPPAGRCRAGASAAAQAAACPSPPCLSPPRSAPAAARRAA